MKVDVNQAGQETRVIIHANLATMVRTAVTNAVQIVTWSIVVTR